MSSVRHEGLRSALLVLVLVAACAPAATPTVEPGPADAAPPAAPPGSAHELLDRMRAQYDTGWSGTLRYVQSNTLFRSDGGESRSEWVRQVAAPGRVRIDYLPLSTRSGVIYEGGRAHVVLEGRRVRTEQRLDPRHLLLGDLARRPVDTTAHLLRTLGFALDSLRAATWEGRPVWVLGAAPGDSTRAQLWVDAERYVPLRLIYPETGGTRPIVTDTRFRDWTDHDGVPMAGEVLQVRDGKPVWREEARRIEIGPVLPAATFDPERWMVGQPTQFVVTP